MTKNWQARLGGIAAILAVCAGPLPVTAQDEGFTPPRADQYAQVTGWPDFTGVWNPDWSILFGRNGRVPANPVLTPEAQAAYDAFLEQQEREGVDQFLQVNCIPPGMPGIMRQPYPIEFLYSPGRVTIFAETYSQARRIYVDPDRDLPEDPDPLFNGTSVGFWEGDRLVVNTVGFNPYVTFMAGVTPSDEMRIHEHFWLDQEGTLWLETTITDPQVLAEPFVQTLAYSRQPDWEIREYVCNENNRLVDDENGANVDLGLEEEGDPFGPPVED
ncbi:hypothetical protein [Aurantiacibacter hainanensis]|uniref:hypothetical protein n=1 Tax=Aurantiacibacter hainanensis TaxID=3076114 RepID=UPI0030C68565